MPIEDREAIDKAVHGVLGDPDIFSIAAGDVQLLPKVLGAAGGCRNGRDGEGV